ncbi:MAG: excinuclease ABC subunit UvrA [Candidatus Dependentiae bacterium]|nr:excinuclease ABC subunit UvrA [Candidatus Dependentiae bacterium]
MENKKSKNGVVTDVGNTPIDTKKFISVVGAREHNLKDVSVVIPKDALTVITGPSGSGKSSLAFDVLYAEGQRRYLESLSLYARQFLGMPPKAQCERIEGLCPAIAIDQKTVGANPRSMVGTITEVYDYLRVLFARIGVVHCPACHIPVQSCSIEHIVKLIGERFAALTVSVIAPVAIRAKGTFVSELTAFVEAGVFNFVVDEKKVRLDTPDAVLRLALEKTKLHTIDAIIDTLEVVPTSIDERARLYEAVERAAVRAAGACKLRVGSEEHWFSTKKNCLQCGRSVADMEPRHFSFNAPLGACVGCSGLGVTMEEGWWARGEERCLVCEGKRLNEQALSVYVGGLNIYEICQLSVRRALAFFKNIMLPETERTIATGLINEIIHRLHFLDDVGLAYLTLWREARSLSGGEGQRIRLARQLGSALTGVMYVLDEPSIGLHQRDNDRLIETLKRLRDIGNTVIVVEHDIDTMRSADHLIDLGPGAGVRGGHVVAAGTPAEVAQNATSVTGQFLAGSRSIRRVQPVRTPTSQLRLEGATAHNLKNVTIELPLGVLCAVSGVSGSGKSSLVIDELVPAVQNTLAAHGGMAGSTQVRGAEKLRALVVVDQSPIGRTPRSNPATYTGVFDDIRALFASLPESNARGYSVGRFSFNARGGRCEMCKGDGAITIEMHFLPDVTVPCRSCDGKRFNAQTLEIRYRGKSISDVLNMTVDEALEFFATHKNIHKKLALLAEVGLGYVALGQPATTLSGGEAQRIKLVYELAKRGSQTLYVLDEPTTGLHACDCEKLLEVLNRLVDKGNSVLVIEHNLDVLKTADYLIDLGPEGGDEGGRVVACGRPEEVAASQQSHTGRYLKQVLSV